MTILQRYVLREILGPIGLGLLVFTFVFLIGQIFRLTDLLLNSGVPASLAGEIILLILPGVMSLTIPMAVLVGILLGFGRLAADREILAIRTSGVNLVHVCIPIIMFSMLLTGLMTWANARAVPYLNLKVADLKLQLMFSALSAIPAGQPFEMPSEGQGMDSTFFYSKKDPKTGAMLGVMMYNQFPVSSSASKKSALAADLRTSGLTAAEKALDNKTHQGANGQGKHEKSGDKASRAVRKAQKLAAAGGQGKKKASTPEDKLQERRDKEKRDWDELVNQKMREALVIASRATFYPDMEKRLIQVELTSGSMHITDPDNRHAYDTVRFDKLTKGIVPSFDKFDKGSYERDPREMSNAEIHKQISIRDKGHRYSVELYRRFSIPFACLAFALIALPLAVYVRPTGKAVAFAISFLLILVYYGLLEYGTALGQTNSPFGPMTIFLPNLLLAGIGAVLLYRMVMK